MKKNVIGILLFLILSFETLQGAVCSYDSGGWSTQAFQDINPFNMYMEGVDDLNKANLEFAFYIITGFYYAMEQEKRTGLKFARANAVSTALDYELSRLEEDLYNVQKVKATVVNMRIEVSLLLNEIQMGILAIKSNEVIADEKKEIFGR